MKRCHLRLIVGIAAVAVASVLLVSGWKWRYPYGWSHSCDMGLSVALETYAEDHHGAFPAGEATPEASLSLLYPKYLDGEGGVEILRGKTVPFEIVWEKLRRGERLTPDTCGWHYVEGLRRGDDGRLALAWDKVGLGHNGERMAGGGHMVIFVSGIRDHIHEAEWATFLCEQKELLRARKGKQQ
jgi:hypothetical protein